MTRAFKRKQQLLAQEAKATELANSILSNVAGGPATASVPPGLFEMLQLKTVLQTELRTAVEKPIVVSVDLKDNEWVFVVRGYKPPFNTWNGHNVYHMVSSSVGPKL